MTYHRAAALAAVLALSAGTAYAQDGAALLEQNCASCHEKSDAGLTRINGQRKTPEGWLMTIVRMRIAHGMEISNEDQAALVSYLSETQGLAPSETTGFRYALEKDPAHIEANEEPLASMCARCHTGARVALQRRTPEEWTLHMDFHVGQFPTIEYQALGRDREWYKIAKEEIAPLLSKMYPLETEAWTAWKAATKPSVAGDWVVLTELPESGPAYGTITVSGDASPYSLSGKLTLADGSSADVGGQMNLYTGYEWRANLSIGGKAYRQVLAVSEDGNGLSGRQFQRDNDSLGGRLTGARTGGAATLLGVVPEAAQPGEVTVQAVGVGLGDLKSGGTVEANGSGASVKLTGAAGEAVTLEAGGSSASISFYDNVDRVTVEPEFTIARVGGGSDNGPAPVPAHFKAIGWWNGADGQPGTDDDIRVGEIPAEWSLENHNEAAAAMKDAEFAGKIGADGIFMPAVAGPNPARTFSTNNAGDLKVVAKAGGQTGEARMIVTVQRFIDPPIR
jgi:quinohemoprotein amine dehydrogenase